MLRLILSIIILILVLSFFGISIQAIVNSPAGQANFSYLSSLFVTGWQWLVNFVLGLWHLVTPW